MIFISFLFSPFGRISRSSWWTVQLINAAFMIVIASMAFTPILADPGAVLEGIISGKSTFGNTLTFAFLPTLWIGICASVKRYHDRGKTGLWILVAIIPVLGPMWQLVELGSLSGTKDTNAFGEKPSGFGATGLETRSRSSASGIEWNQNIDAAIADAVANLSAEQSRSTTHSVSDKKPRSGLPTASRASFGRRGLL